MSKNLCKVCLGNKAIYGIKGGKKQYCKDCAISFENVCNLTRKMCLESDCIKEPTYNFPSETTTLYCSEHKKSNMIDVKHKKCQYKDENDKECLISPSYGNDGGKPIYCKNHSELFENMVLISNKLCNYIDENNIKCTTRASFNFEGNKTGKFCKDHKQDDMIYVLKVDKCIEDGCNTRATFNYISEKNGTYCETHKKIDIYNVKDKRCDFINCKKIASFNYENENTYLYCNEHKEPEMINLKSKKCIFDECKSLPSYNYENQTIKLYCGKHKLPNMIDVKHNRCIENNCEKEAFFNYINETKRLYCFAHKKNEMLDLSSKSRLCKNIIGDFNCITRGNKRYDGYCVRCYVGLFPNEPMSRNYKTKELKVCEFIKEKYEDIITLSFDKRIPNGCSKRRPDIYIDLGSHSIIIEVDENQHEDYESSCENKRMMEIFNDLGNRPIVFIRFNPDEYYNKNKEIIKSCWSYSKEGISIINRNKRIEWKSRLNKLLETIQLNIKNEPIKEVNIVHLFYDEI
jgi:hypothetical protein